MPDEPEKPAPAEEPANAVPIAPAESEGEASEGDRLFEALWSRVVEAWDDDKPHGAILDYALRNERLPDLAGRYRALKDDEAKAPRAKKKLDGIVIAATQMMLAMKSPPARTKVPWQLTLAAFVLMALLLAMVGYGLLGRR